MERKDTIEYEVHDPVSNKEFTTLSRDEAAAYFEEEWIVIERQVTICRPSLLTESRMIVSVYWNNNPEFEGV